MNDHIKAHVCPGCGAAFTNAALAWMDAWSEGYRDALLCLRVDQRDGPVKLKCAYCGLKVWYEVFSNTVTPAQDGQPYAHPRPVSHKGQTPTSTRLILIGGTSHAGKSTLSRVLADRIGGVAKSTDTLARHPGRPWAVPPKEVPPHVVEHYLTLSPEQLLADVLRHYRQTVWPLAVALIEAQRAAPAPLVLEGSALLPELVASLPALREGSAQAVFLSAGETTLRSRMHAESGYALLGSRERELVDKFLARAVLFDRHVATSLAAVAERGLPIFTVDAAPGDMVERVVTLLNPV
jgi:hypothetical protein